MGSVRVAREGNSRGKGQPRDIAGLGLKDGSILREKRERQDGSSHKWVGEIVKRGFETWACPIEAPEIVLAFVIAVGGGQMSRLLAAVSSALWACEEPPKAAGST